MKVTRLFKHASLMQCVYFSRAHYWFWQFAFALLCFFWEADRKSPVLFVFHLLLKISMHDKCLENISAIPQGPFKSIWLGNRNHDSALIVHDALKTVSGRRSFPNSTHHKYYPVVLSIVIGNPPVSDLAAQHSHLALVLDWACMKADTSAFDQLCVSPPEF